MAKVIATRAVAIACTNPLAENQGMELKTTFSHSLLLI